MGTDKGLMISGNKTWSQIAKEKMELLPLNCLISINPSQVNAYRRIFKNEELVVDNPLVNVGGPLSGLLSVHHQFPHEDLLILACDLTQMQSIVLLELKNKAQQSPLSEACIFQSQNGIEPLCGVYTARGLEKLEKMYNEGLVEQVSMTYALSNLNTLYLPVIKEWEMAFSNKNTPGDLLENT